MAAQFRRVWFGFLFIWITSLYLMSSWFFQKETCQDESFRQKITEMAQKLIDYEQKIVELESEIKSLKLKTNIPIVQSVSIEIRSEKKSPDHETSDAANLFEVQSKLFRKTSNSIMEFWWYLRDQLNKENYFKNHKDVWRFLQSQFWSIQRDLTYYRDTNPVAANRMKKWNENIITELDKLQNPTDCAATKYIYCNLGKSCGFGCQVHHLVYCFIVAYAHGRTMVLGDGAWTYDPKGWKHYFEPITSDQCHQYVINKPDKTPFSSKNLDTQILSLPIIEDMERVPYLPNAVPDNIARDIEAVHGHPSVWWIGHIVRYLMRPNKDLERKLQDMKNKLGFKKPIVGIHVRRTDKVGVEAAFHDVDEYFSKAEEFHHYINLTSQDRKLRVYLATDEAGAYQDAKKKYPNVDILNNEASTNAAGLNSRYTSDSLLGIAMDVLLLSECDYLVCTFSSQVCRLAYEIMQTRHTDATWRYQSLDDIWYYGGQQHRRFVAIMNHSPQNGKEIELKVGDELGVAGNEKNGFSVGNNLRSGQHGFFPSYKIDEVVIHVKLPRDGG